MISSSRAVCRRILPLFALFCVLPLAGRSQSTVPIQWVSTWGTGMSGASNDLFFAGTSYHGDNRFNNQVVRQIVHASIGGTQVRVRLSNELGTAPVTVGALHIALRDADASIVPGTDRTLTFRGGSPSVTISAGCPEISDAVDLDIPPRANLAVSLYFPAGTTVGTGHPNSQQVTYVSPVDSGDVTTAPTLPLDPGQPTILQWPLLSGVEVKAPGARTFVALGSSITNGTLSTVNANNRWTDQLAKRLINNGLPVGVVNASVVANPLARAGNGGPTMSRFDRDVLARPGVAYVFINDVMGVEIQASPTTLSDEEYAQAVIGVLRVYRARAHSLGIKAYAGTIIPLPASGASYETRRQIINAFIRGGALDGYVDFDAIVRDPADPTRILAAYDGGDQHHLSDAGYKALARGFDLGLFR